eukprot:TRINITY_DN16987_c0_g1_i2.p2 TRINITY_DN16987_c0_g1~~TRINITY_DN16987_c0_g1_i2.p2  ORF type:complete len:178 (-),score=22.49 TRINITY_DN16987_c0_g1_i2:33-566(-)
MMLIGFFFFFSSRRRHTRSCLVSWARRCVQETALFTFKGYFIGSGAVHPQFPLNAGGEARQPIIPFGTRIYLSEPIDIQGNQYNSLVVNDTGDVYYGLWHKYPYWVDVYAGTTNYYSNKAALKAHVLCVDTCLLYTSDAADDMQCVDLGGRRVIKKKKKKQITRNKATENKKEKIHA